MKLTTQAIRILHEGFSNRDYEIGGILGSSSEGIITHVLFDQLSQPPEHHCCYTPNVDFLNSEIENWQRREIRFMGMFHSHFGGASLLSPADTEYIRHIMSVMPPSVKFLYFPVYVVSEKELISYRADRSGKLEQEKTIVFDR